VRAVVSLSGARTIGTPGPDDAPALLLHNSPDFMVLYQWAEDTVNSARDAGLFAELVSWQEAGHVPYGEHRDEIIDRTTNFLYWMLGLLDV
jgi:hypothetical protein